MLGFVFVFVLINYMMNSWLVQGLMRLELLW